MLVFPQSEDSEESTQANQTKPYQKSETHEALSAADRFDFVAKSLNVRHGEYYRRRAQAKQAGLQAFNSLADETGSSLWRILGQQFPERSYKAVISKHAVIDEESPFTLYAI